MSELLIRDFPPVEPIDVPQRFSQTILRHANRCLRSAYLYRKYRGGAASHALNRGTVGHIAFERFLEHMREHSEQRIPPEVAKDIMAEAIAETPITIPSEEQNVLRVMAYHFAEGVVVEPHKIKAIEQKFVLPIDEFTVVGKIDVAFVSGEEAEVWDWKTAMAMTEMEELAEKLRDGRLAPKGFQLLLYVLLLAFGQPVTEIVCGTCQGKRGDPRFPERDDRPCPDCGGRGEWEELGDPLADRVNFFTAYEMYPQFLYDDGLGHRGPLTLTKSELIDHRIMLEGHVFKLAEAFETWKFEAVPGTHCQECPARGECPIPEHLRSWAGEINSAEQAAEAMEKNDKDEERVKAVKKEARNWAKANDGFILVGADEVWDFRKGESRNTNWAGVETALERAMEYGEPFRLTDHQTISQSNTFRKRKRLPGEFGREEVATDGSSDRAATGSRFGDDPPF